MTEVLYPILIAVLVFCVILTSLYWQTKRARVLLHKWAGENALEIKSASRRYLFSGPFFLTTSKGQVVFYVFVKDANGKFAHVWVRCGSHFLGMWSDKVDVSWVNKRRS